MIDLLQRLHASWSGMADHMGYTPAMVALEKEVRAALSSDREMAPEAKAKALEFAEYMAKGGEQLLNALAGLYVAVEAQESLEVDASEADKIEAEEGIARADRAIAEHMRGLRSDIYEFRKHAALASSAHIAQRSDRE